MTALARDALSILDGDEIRGHRRGQPGFKERVDFGEIIGTYVSPDGVIAAEVETYVVADFLPPVDVHFTAVDVPSGKQRTLLTDEAWIYRRREDDEEGKREEG